MASSSENETTCSSWTLRSVVIRHHPLSLVALEFGARHAELSSRLYTGGFLATSKDFRPPLGALVGTDPSYDLKSVLPSAGVLDGQRSRIAELGRCDEHRSHRQAFQTPSTRQLDAPESDDGAHRLRGFLLRPVRTHLWFAIPSTECTACPRHALYCCDRSCHKHALNRHRCTLHSRSGLGETGRPGTAASCGRPCARAGAWLLRRSGWCSAARCGAGRS